MNFLVSNDDGINAYGLRVLVKALAELPDVKVYVSAPDGERSASGHGITTRNPIFMRMEEVEGAEWACALTGSPADCVKFAIKHLKNVHNVVIDGVFAGINHGSNIGTDVFYSGTLAAASEGALCKLPAVAVSVGTHHPLNEMLENCKTLIQDVATRVISEMEKGTILNINFPAVKPEEIKGLKVTKLGPREYDEKFDLLESPKGFKYYWYSGDALIYESLPEDLDVIAYQEGFVSVTPLRLELTDLKKRKELKKLNIRI